MSGSAQQLKDEPPEVGEAKREFGQRLERLRINAGFDALKDLAKPSGVSYTTLKDTAAGKNFPTFNTASKIARACRTKAGEDRQLVAEANQFLTDWKAVDQVVDPTSGRYGTKWPPVSVGKEAQQHGVLDGRAKPGTDAEPGPADPSPPTEQTSASSSDGGSNRDRRAGGHKFPAWVVPLLVLVVLVLIAFVVVQQLPGQDPSNAGGESTASTPPAVRVEVPVRFNALGGTSSSIIRVFAGVTDSAADRQKTGTFPDKEVATASCKKTGRTVVSDTSAGEEPRSSNMWVRLATPSSEAMYAALTYADIAPKDLAKLPLCT